jgi:hypothetical protein
MSRHKSGSPVSFGFDDFAGVCNGRMTARACSQSHWQLLGGRRIVNLWPTTGKVMLDSGESGRVRTVDDVEAFIGKHNIFSKPEANGQVHVERHIDGVRYGIAVLQIEYWTLIRDGHDARAGNLLNAIKALEAIDNR